jgi:outer membrane receptor for ferrienterochelin and colicins
MAQPYRSTLTIIVWSSVAVLAPSPVRGADASGAGGGAGVSEAPAPDSAALRPGGATTTSTATTDSGGGAADRTAPAGGEPAPAAVTEGAEAAASDSDESRAATQVASFATTQLKDSPAVVTVISGEDIRTSGARDLIDILYLVPGYFIGLDTQGIVGPGFRGLWGHEGKILLMIDGKEMNELLFSSMQLGNEFPVELIERVEVVRGPGSVIYGGSAELSVINVVTRGLQGSTDAMATVSYGQMTDAGNFERGYGRRRVTASGRYIVDSVPGLSTFASVSVGQGQRSVRTFVDDEGASATMEGRSKLDPMVVHAGVGYKDVQASFLYHRMATTSITGFGTVIQAAPEAVHFDAFHGELVGAFRPSDRFEIVPRLNVSYQVPWHAPNDTGDFFYDKAVRRVRGRLLGRWAALDQLQVTVGGDGMFDEAHLRSPADPLGGPGLQTQFGSSDQISYQTFGTFVELYSENPIVNVAAGARYDHQSTVGGALVPRLVLLKSFGPVGLKGLFSLSFRAPGVENLNLNMNPDTDLRPERTRIFEFEGYVDVAAYHRLSANVYDVAIDAPIVYIVDSTDPMNPTEGYLNLGRQGTRGFEVAYRLRHPLLRLDANYSFYAPSVARDTTNYDVPGHSNMFLAAPAHRAALRATVRPFAGFGISPTVVVLGPRFSRGPVDMDGNETALEIPAQVLANLFVYKENVGVPGLTVGLGVYNIFGADYRFIRASGSGHPPLPGLDREVMLRLSYLFEPG